MREFLINSFANSKSKILEVGSTNGFTSLEIARILNCKVWGIDINKKSINNAKRRVNKEKVKFSYGNAYKIPFNDEKFDIVFCSNATSFMEDKQKAISEYIRVLKPWGFIAICPMYYIKNPSEKLLDEMSKTINVKIEKKTKEDWLKIFEEQNLEIYYCNDYLFDDKKSSDIKDYVKKSLDKPHITNNPKIDKKQIEERGEKTISIFNKNLSHVGYSVILLRKRKDVEEAEMFTTKVKRA